MSLEALFGPVISWIEGLFRERVNLKVTLSFISDRRNTYFRVNAVNKGRPCYVQREGLVDPDGMELYPESDYPFMKDSTRLEKGQRYGPTGIYHPFILYQKQNNPDSVMTRLLKMGYKEGEVIEIRGFVETTEGHKPKSPESYTITVQNREPQPLPEKPWRPDPADDYQPSEDPESGGYLGPR